MALAHRSFDVRKLVAFDAGKVESNLRHAAHANQGEPPPYRRVAFAAWRLMEVNRKTAAMVDANQLSVIIPVFNSAGGLPELLDRLTTVLPSCSARSEVILVDDGSRDESWPAIQALAARGPRVR